MNHNRKRREAEDRQRRRQEADVRNNVQVDPKALAPCNSYGWPEFIGRGYYLDVSFTCASCGTEEVWPASQQKWWYEVAKGSVYSRAKLCQICREEARLCKGKAHPLQNAGRWLGLIRDDIEPALLASGWHPVIGIGESRPMLLSYGRGDVLVRLRWDSSSYRTALILERRDVRDAPFQTLVQIGCDTYDMTHGELQRRFDSYLSMVKDQLGSKAKP